MSRQRNAFSLVELLICIAVIAVLLAILLPLLSGAKEAGNKAVCASNLRQINVAFQLYVQDNKESLPRYAERPLETDWRYGGATFVGSRALPILDGSRPVNRYLGGDVTDSMASGVNAALFHCPSDRGVFRGSRGSQHGTPALSSPSCYREFGTSYRANSYLLNSGLSGIDGLNRPLRLVEIQGTWSRILLLGDADWWYATRDENEEDAGLEASWHREVHKGHMLALDGSLRFVNFAKYPDGEFDLLPRVRSVAKPAKPEANPGTQH